MNAQQYQQWSNPLRQRPALLSFLKKANNGLTLLGYVMYPLLVAILFFTGDSFLLKAILVPGIGFVLVSVARKLINEPRPYEALDIDPLIKKDTKGQSLPSRHTFSMFMIAFTWLAWMPPVGSVLLLAGFALAVIRVLGGVHYPHDVIAGAICALVFAILGFWVL